MRFSSDYPCGSGVFEVSQAGLDDWAEIKALVQELQRSPASQYVGCQISEAEALLVNSITNYHTGFLVLRFNKEGWRTGICGMVSMLIVDAPRAGQIGFTPTRQGFIHSVYISPQAELQGPRNTATELKLPYEAGLAMMDGIEHWSRSRGATWIYGNVRLDGRFGGFWRKFGMKPKVMCVGKSLQKIQVSGVEDLPEEAGFEPHQVVVEKEL